MEQNERERIVVLENEVEHLKNAVENQKQIIERIMVKIDDLVENLTDVKTKLAVIMAISSFVTMVGTIAIQVVFKRG